MYTYICLGAEETLHQFAQYLNTCQSFFKFTFYINTESIPFLDLEIKNKDNHLIASLYRKPMERTHNYSAAPFTHRLAKMDFPMANS